MSAAFAIVFEVNTTTLRPNEVPADQVPRYLNNRAARLESPRDQNGNPLPVAIMPKISVYEIGESGKRFVFSVLFDEVLTLARRGCVIGIIDTRQQTLRELRLLPGFSARKAMLLINNRMANNVGGGVSKRRQQRGSKIWVERLDKADTGQTGLRRTVIFYPLDKSDRRHE